MDEHPGGFWGMADSLVSGYWTHDRSWQDSEHASFWNPPSQIDYFGEEFMISSEFISSEMEAPFDPQAFQGSQIAGAPINYLDPAALRSLQDAFARIGLAIPSLSGSVRITFPGATAVLPLPWGAPPISPQQLGGLGTAAGTAAMQWWGRALQTDPEGALSDEFAWMPLKPSTVKRKMAQGMSEADARKPNFGSGQTAREMTEMVFGGPTISQTPKGAEVAFGPKASSLESRIRLKWWEMQFGAGGDSPLPASGRQHHTLRPARPYRFTIGMMNAMEDVMRDWVKQVNADIASRFGEMIQLSPDQLYWERLA